MKTMKYIGIAAVTCLAVLSGCTKNFEDYNTNKHEATSEQMSQDNLKTGALFRQMQRFVIIIADGQKIFDSDYQITYNLNADTFAGYFAPTNGANSFNNGNNSSAYNMVPQWNRAMWNYKNENTMSAYQLFRAAALADGQQEVAAMGDILKVASMHQVTDYYGPIPYTKAAESITPEYDSQETVYKAMLDELDNAVDLLTTYYAQGNTRILADYDYVYGGNVENWIRFANSLRLRLAMRCSYANPTLAQTEAEKSLTHSIGVITDNSQNARISHGALTYHHPIWEIAYNFNDGDTHMGASMDCYLNGYSDPRTAIYWKAAVDGNYHGVRPGVQATVWTNYGNAANKVSSPNVDNSTTEVVWFNAAESYFLKAEAALRGWNAGDTAQNLYESGIKASFEQTGAANVATYIANTTAVPAAFVDNAGSNNAAAPSTVKIAWSTASTTEAHLEQILTQKWIAIYPNGCEAWAEFRRTGYPKLITVASNRSGGVVNTDVQIRRIPYPEEEYTRNLTELNKGIALLGGADNAGTKLWWDKK